MHRNPAHERTDRLLVVGRYNAKAELPFLITDKRSQWGKTTWGLTRCSGIQLWSKTVRFRIFRVKTFCFWHNISFLRHKVENGMLPHEEQSSSRSETHIYKHQMTKQQSFHYQNVQKKPSASSLRNLNLHDISFKKTHKIVLLSQQYWTLATLQKRKKKKKKGKSKFYTDFLLFCVWLQA